MSGDRKIIHDAFRPTFVSIDTKGFDPVEFFAHITNNFTIKHANQVIRDLRKAISQGSHDAFVEKVYERGLTIAKHYIGFNNGITKYTRSDYESIIKSFSTEVNE